MLAACSRHTRPLAARSRLDASHAQQKNVLARQPLQLLTLLKSKGIPMAEHHYASLLQSWIAIDDLEAAMYTLALMRLEGCPPNSETANPLLGLVVRFGAPLTRHGWVGSEEGKENKPARGEKDTNH